MGGPLESFNTAKIIHTIVSSKAIINIINGGTRSGATKPKAEKPAKMSVAKRTIPKFILLIKERVAKRTILILFITFSLFSILDNIHFHW